MKIEIVRNDSSTEYLMTDGAVAADYIKVIDNVIELLHGHEKTWKGHKIPKCYKLGIKKDEELLFEIELSKAAVPDYLNFIDNFIKIIQSDKVALEKEANASGRTIEHEFYGAVGSVEIKNTIHSKDPK